MTTTEAKENIDYLKNQLRLIKSRKLKCYYIADILSLENFIVQFEPEFDSGISQKDFLYKDYRRRLLLEKEKRALEVLYGNDINSVMAKKVISLYEEVDFTPFIAFRLDKVDDNRYIELFRDFMHSLGPRVYNTYNKLIKEESILSMNLPNEGGVCWDFPILDKQIIVSDECQGQYSYLAIAHEIGHAVHFNALNQMGRRRFEINTFGETLSILLEKLFIKYLEDNGIDTFLLNNFVYSERLEEVIGVDMCSELTKQELEEFDGYDIIFPNADAKMVDREDSKYASYYDFLGKGLTYLKYLYYFLGNISSSYFISKYGENSEECISRTLDFLISSELVSHERNVRKLELQNADLTLMRKRLDKYGHRN